MLRSTATITGLATLATDLHRSDGLAILPAAAISATFAQNAIEPGDVVTMTVRMNLDGLSAGEYTGEVLLLRAEGTSNLPITVRVRHWWVGPMLLLVGALLVGLWFGHYRTHEQPRDDIIVQVGYLSEQVDADTQLLPVYRARINQGLAAAR